MRVWLLAAFISLAACAPSQPAALSSPPVTPTRSPLSTQSPSPPTGVASTLNCRLPVISPTSSADPVPGGWITFPGGQFTRDPTSLPGRLQSHVPSYDRATGRWVPVEYTNVAPDGASYVLHGDSSLETNGFYLVDARTGSRRLLLASDGPLQAPASWTVIEYASVGVYLWSTGIRTVPGLWLLDPLTGKVRLVDGSHYWEMVGGGAAWAIDPPSGAPASTYTVYRLDLATGAVTTWYQTNTPVGLLSPTPDGDVLITYGDRSSAQLGLITASNQLIPLAVPRRIYVGTQGYLSSPGVWIPLQPGGLALYLKGEGVSIMATSTNIFSVAGDCQ
jgi:hypothetical protein